MLKMSLCNILCRVLILNVLLCECANIFHESSKILYHPDEDSEYFGYSVILSNQRLFVGAPKAKSRFGRGITSGLVFKCPVQDLDTYRNVSCLPIGAAEEIEDRILARAFAREDLFKDGMWFGATLSATPSGAVFMCAPRWTKPHKNTHMLQNGMCYMLASRMGKEYLPLVDPRNQAFLSDNQRPEYGEFGTTLNYYAYGQAGFSVKLFDTGVIIGAPGLVQWTGGVVEYRPIDKSFKTAYLSKQTTINPYYTKEVGPDEYLGYSVESGIFQKNGTTLIVAGAPRSHFGYGQVLIFETSIQASSPLNIKYKVVGDQLGSYFGATLLCTDLNGDGIVDLLVGAPNYVKKDGILHYDQGAVFVYLTNIQGVNFTLDTAGYVSGTEESGARFGSSIADLGDIDGDGFNDIAIGAPWEDEGKGAVYIYRGSKKGLNKKYDQRITVADSKTFGYSISKGVDVDQNNCSDLAVGAYNISAAYIFRCIPTVHVNVSIRVPDAVNLPVNATNFTALFCVKSTPRTVVKGEAMAQWLMKSVFTARVTIDTKENRARFEGDTEYDLSITAGDDKCNEQIVLVKPTADLSKPISIKFNLEENGSLEDSEKFPSYGARLSADSVLETSFDIQLRRDCGEDLICKPLLLMFLVPLSRTYIPGTDDRLGFKVSVLNTAEPSYGAKVHLTLPSSPKRLPSECSLEELVVTCHLPAPLSRSESIEWEIELEYTYRDSVAKELNVAATLEDPLYNGTDIVMRKRMNLVILIEPKAKFAISGKALPNATIVVTREKFNEASNVNLVHYYEVTNFGPSDWFRLPVQVHIPEKMNLSSPIKGCLGLSQKLECTWTLPAQVSMPIVLPLYFDLGIHGNFLYEKNKFNVTTTILILQEGRNISESITTTLIIELAAPIWPYIVGGVTGLLLLLVMILIFYKYGFFSRNRPGNFKKLKEEQQADEANSSGSNPEDVRSFATAEVLNICGAEDSSLINETSSLELLGDDSS